jgi:hypothetical protein
MFFMKKYKEENQYKVVVVSALKWIIPSLRLLHKTSFVAPIIITMYLLTSENKIVSYSKRLWIPYRWLILTKSRDIYIYIYIVSNRDIYSAAQYFLIFMGNHIIFSFKNTNIYSDLKWHLDGTQRFVKRFKWPFQFFPSVWLEIESPLHIIIFVTT